MNRQPYDLGDWLEPDDKLLKDNEIPVGNQCPNCNSTETELGYGLAGGGCDVYNYCNKCNCVFDKVQDEE